MFQEVKEMLPVMGDDYDAQIITQIKAAALDLTTSAEIKLPGVIAITRTQNQQGIWTVNDQSTVTDELIIVTIATWCNMMIGNPPNVDFLKKAYEGFKGQLRLSKNYTTYGGSENDEDDGQL